MLKKILLFIAVMIVIFSAAGLLVFNKRPAPSQKIDLFLKGFENEKIGLYYFNLGKLSKSHSNILLSITDDIGKKHEACYDITTTSLKKTNDCKKDIVISLDNHAMGSLLANSYDAKNIILSEYLTGHFKITGLGLKDIPSVIR